MSSEPPSSGPPMSAMPPAAAGPGAEQITLNTIREWAEREMQFDPPAAGTHAAGRRAAARDIRAILAMHGRPPNEPVIFGGEVE